MWVTAKPVYDDKWQVILYDMYVDGEWHGSRRTLEQVKAHFRFLGLLE